MLSTSVLFLLSSIVVLVAPPVTSLPCDTSTRPFDVSVHFAFTVLVHVGTSSPVDFHPFAGAEVWSLFGPLDAVSIPVPLMRGRGLRIDLMETSSEFMALTSLVSLTIGAFAKVKLSAVQQYIPIPIAAA